MIGMALRPSSKSRRFLWRSVRVILACPLLYGAAALIGLIPANSGFRPASAGVDIYVASNGVHTDIIVPSKSDETDWSRLFPASDFPSNETLRYIRFGWGDRKFYIETPTWADVSAASVLRSLLLPTSATMHVEYAQRPLESSRCRRVRLESKHFRKLVNELQRAIVLNSDGLPIRISDAGYHSRDGFYEAYGSYHLFNTCNSWTGRTLRDAGIGVGIWTPFPYSVMSTLRTGE